MLNFKRILVPIDFSLQSKTALTHAVQLASGNKRARLYLLHVLPLGQAIDFPGELLEDRKQIMAREEREAEADLKEFRKKVPTSCSVTTLVKRGARKEIILDVCRKESIDLIVLTTHGATGLKRLSQPNFSEVIVRSAPCAVLVFHLRKVK